jgi:TonB-dependent receptor
VRATRDAQALALNQQRSSENYKNVISADLLGRFPDANLAESTQRIPGVSIERDQGEGRYVNVRGAPLEFTSVSVDGVPLSAPNASRRTVELDTIPADVIAALEVTKALTPDMDGDAIAGQINIVTQSALDRDGPPCAAPPAPAATSWAMATTTAPTSRSAPLRRRRQHRRAAGGLGQPRRPLHRQRRDGLLPR